jgi:hypothetical protein
MKSSLLYYTTIILLHRPFYSATAHHQACRRAADSLERLLLLLEGTFGFARVTYLVGYCIYTGASVMTHDVKAGDVDASRKMQTFLRALHQGTKTCPILQRSLDIINNCLRTDPASYTGSTPRPEDTLNVMIGNYLPAFPYLESQVGPDPSSQTMDLSLMDLDGFSLLDSFPENHIGTNTAEWYLPS